MTQQSDFYVDLKGRIYFLSELDEQERELVHELQKRAEPHPEWSEFNNFWIKAVPSLYEPRGLSRREITQTPVWKIAQDLSGRIAVAAGLAQPPDYRDELEEIIRQKFRTRREFCEHTGISEDMLSHVLARRKHLSLDALLQALDKLGYSLHITPNQPVKAGK
jgi:hypothetical protein